MIVDVGLLKERIIFCQNCDISSIKIGYWQVSNSKLNKNRGFAAVTRLKQKFKKWNGPNPAHNMSTFASIEELEYNVLISGR